MTGVLIREKRGGVETDMQGESPKNTMAETGVIQQAKGCLGLPAEARKEAWDGFSLRALERNQPPDTLISDS